MITEGQGQQQQEDSHNIPSGPSLSLDRNVLDNNNLNNTKTLQDEVASIKDNVNILMESMKLLATVVKDQNKSNQNNTVASTKETNTSLNSTKSNEINATNDFNTLTDNKSYAALLNIAKNLIIVYNGDYMDARKDRLNIWKKSIQYFIDDRNLSNNWDVIKDIVLQSVAGDAKLWVLENINHLNSIEGIFMGLENRFGRLNELSNAINTLLRPDSNDFTTIEQLFQTTSKIDNLLPEINVQQILTMFALNALPDEMKSFVETRCNPLTESWRDILLEAKEYENLNENLEMNVKRRFIDSQPNDNFTKFKKINSLTSNKETNLNINSTRKNSNNNRQIANVNDSISKKNKNLTNEIKCFRCNNYGHYKKNCPLNKPISSNQSLKIENSQSYYY